MHIFTVAAEGFTVKKGRIPVKKLRKALGKKMYTQDILKESGGI